MGDGQYTTPTRGGAPNGRLHTATAKRQRIKNTPWKPWNEADEAQRHRSATARRRCRMNPEAKAPLAGAPGSASFWWMPRRTDPMHSGWYYVREVQPRLCVGIRYFDDSDQTWWAVSKDGKNDGSLVPNETFHDWLTIPNITDRQRG